MKEYIIDILIEEFEFSITDAYEFYDVLVERDMVEIFINNINEFYSKKRLIDFFVEDSKKWVMR